MPARALADGSALTSHHLLKVLALVLMTADHVGAYLWPDALWLRVLGRLSVPIWFFLIGQAPAHRLRRPLVLWAGAMAAITPFVGTPVFPLNNLVTLGLCTLLLAEVEKRQWLDRYPLTLLVACTVFLLPSYAFSEYGSLGFLYALLGYAVRYRRMGWREGGALAVAAPALFFILQSASFSFTLTQQLVLAAALALQAVLLLRFRHRPLSYPRALASLQPVTVFLSRVSLQYYVIHRIILQALGVSLGVLAGGLRWF